MIALPTSNSPMQDTDISVLNDIIAESKKELAPSMKDDEFWELFAAKEILRDRQLSPDDIQSGMVGQTEIIKESDGGIDAFYTFVNGTLIRDQLEAENSNHKKGVEVDVIIIQSKTTAGFGMDAINRLSTTCDSIFRTGLEPKNFPEPFNARLVDAIVRFRSVYKSVLTKQPNISVHFFNATKGDSASTRGVLGAKADELTRKVKDVLATIQTCEFEFLGARDFIELWKKPRKCEFQLRVAQNFPDGNGGYVALVQIGEFYKFITDGGKLRDFLFESNVRSYEGNGAVNTQIRDTLDNRASKIPFWWLTGC
jgi:hypothetical protein